MGGWDLGWVLNGFARWVLLDLNCSSSLFSIYFFFFFFFKLLVICYVFYGWWIWFVYYWIWELGLTCWEVWVRVWEFMVWFMVGFWLKFENFLSWNLRIEFELLRILSLGIRIFGLIQGWFFIEIWEFEFVRWEFWIWHMC